jgi:ubiquinol-cytochrome c reductase cytochrome b subunit
MHPGRIQDVRGHWRGGEEEGHDGALGALGALGVLTVALPPVVGLNRSRASKSPCPVAVLVDVHAGKLDRPVRHRVGRTALFILLIAVPFVDRNARRHWRSRPVAMTLAAAVVLAIVVLFILAVTTPAQHLM